MTNTTPLRQFHNIPQAVTENILQADTSGTLTLFAGAVGTTVDIWGVDLTALIATTIQIKSGTEVKMSWQVPANGRIFRNLPSGPRLGGQTGAFPVCQSNDGDAVTLVWSNSATLCGSVSVVARATGAI